MPLRDQAHRDLIEIMNDPDTGGVPITISNPAGDSLPFNAFESDIHMAIDAGTGEFVTGRQVHVSVLISALIAVGYDSIHGVADTSTKPWAVRYLDVNNRVGNFKVIETNPDNSRGLMPIKLECYEPLE